MCISWGYLHPPLSQLPGTSNPECCLLFPFCIHLSGPPSSPCIDFHSLCPKSSGHRSVIFQLPKCCCHRLLFHFGHMGLCLYRLYFTVLLEKLGEGVKINSGFYPPSLIASATLLFFNEHLKTILCMFLHF